jgi:hypothetical protein
MMRREIPRRDDGPHDRERQFLHLPGFIHELNIAPAGSVADPWPFMLEIDSGQGSASCLLHVDDAQQIVDFFSQFLPKGVQAHVDGV